MMPILIYDNTDIQEYPVLNEYLYNTPKQNSKNIVNKNSENDNIYTITGDTLFFFKENDNTQSKIKKEMDSFLIKYNSILEFEKSFYKQEDIEFPNDFAFDYMSTVLEFLLTNGVKPYKIAPSVEEGICMVFKNENKKLHFEIYNDGDKGYIIEDYVNKKIIKDKDISTVEEAVNDIVNFERNEIS